MKISSRNNGGRGSSSSMAMMMNVVVGCCVNVDSNNKKCCPAAVMSERGLGFGVFLTIMLYCCMLNGWALYMSWNIRTMIHEGGGRGGLLSSLQSSPQVYYPDSNHRYDPLGCRIMVNGHCQDEDGKAWSYRRPDGSCLHRQERDAPSDRRGAMALAFLLRSDSVLDFGGGVGAYMVPFRDFLVQKNSTGTASMTTPTSESTLRQARKFVVVEPQPLGDCLLRDVQQDTRDWLHLPLTELPNEEYELTMSIEVLEHIPVEFHQHIVQALAQASKEYMVLSVAHPGQPGEGHVGLSLKERDQWIIDVQNWTDFEYDRALNQLWLRNVGMLLRKNAAIYRRKVGTGSLPS